MQQTSEQETPSWLVDIRDYISTGNIADAGKLRTISRVSDNLLQVQRSAFVPNIISIGPLHYTDRKSKLKAMEKHKIRFLVRSFRFEENGYSSDEEVSNPVKRQIAEALEHPMEAMRNMEQKTRACYSEPFNHISSDDFVRMMLFDGFFVVELLRLFHRSSNPEEYRDGEGIEEELVYRSWMLRKLQRDLLKLENQLPYFVLETIHQMLIYPTRISLPELIVYFFNPLLPRNDWSTEKPPNEEYNHMLGLFRSTFINQDRQELEPYASKLLTDWDDKYSCRCFSGESSLIHATYCHWIVYHRVLRPRIYEERLKPEILQLPFMHLTPPLEDLHENGGIVVKKKDKLDLLDINFKDGVLDFPLLVLDDDTVPMLFNFVALEECMGGLSPFISYFLLLNSLICSVSDAEILRKERIIEHSLESNKDVVCLIKELAKKMVYDEGNPYYFHAQVMLMNDYHNASLRNKRAQRKLKWSRWWKDLKAQYFSNPWAILSLFAAIVLLILTFIQTFYTMFAYYKPPNMIN